MMSITGIFALALLLLFLDGRLLGSSVADGRLLDGDGAQGAAARFAPRVVATPPPGAPQGQGLPLVHFSAQAEPSLSLKPPNTFQK